MTYKSRQALVWSAEALITRLQQGGGAVFVTLTFPCHQTADECAGAWDSLRKRGRRERWWPLDGVRVFERHKSGSFHVHAILPESCARSLQEVAHECGFGNIDVRPVWGLGVAGYLADEIGKRGQKDMAGAGRPVRVWAAWGSSRTRVKDVTITTLFTQLRAAWKPLRARNSFKLYRLIGRALFKGWQPDGDENKFEQWRVLRLHLNDNNQKVEILR